MEFKRSYNRIVIVSHKIIHVENTHRECFRLATFATFMFFTFMPFFPKLNSHKRPVDIIDNETRFNR